MKRHLLILLGVVFLSILSSESVQEHIHYGVWSVGFYACLDGEKLAEFANTSSIWNFKSQMVPYQYSWMDFRGIDATRMDLH